MSKGAYIGVGNSAKKIKSIYIGVNGVAKKVKKAYIGVNNVAKLWWSSGLTRKLVNTIDVSQLPSSVIDTDAVVKYIAGNSNGDARTGNYSFAGMAYGNSGDDDEYSDYYSGFDVIVHDNGTYVTQNHYYFGGSNAYDEAYAHLYGKHGNSVIMNTEGYHNGSIKFNTYNENLVSTYISLNNFTDYLNDLGNSKRAKISEFVGLNGSTHFVAASYLSKLDPNYVLSYNWFYTLSQSSTCINDYQARYLGSKTDRYLVYDRYSQYMLEAISVDNVELTKNSTTVTSGKLYGPAINIGNRTILAVSGEYYGNKSMVIPITEDVVVGTPFQVDLGYWIRHANAANINGIAFMSGSVNGADSSYNEITIDNNLLVTPYDTKSAYGCNYIRGSQFCSCGDFGWNVFVYELTGDKTNFRGDSKGRIGIEKIEF